MWFLEVVSWNTYNRLLGVVGLGSVERERDSKQKVGLHVMGHLPDVEGSREGVEGNPLKDA